MCECKPTVLLAENNPGALETNRELLEAEGYKVITASSPGEAMDHARKEVVHLAVIDVRLVDDGDEDDLSGLHLAKDLPDTICRVITTAQKWGNLASLFKRILGRDRRGRTLAYTFVEEYDPEELLAAVREAFENEVPIDPKLRIEMAHGLSWETMVDQIRMFYAPADARRVPADEAGRQRGVQLLRDLTCRLFHGAKAGAVRFLSTTPGYSPCTVAVVRPSFKGVQGMELAVKYGPRTSIEREVENYNQWVKPFMQGSTRLEYEPVWSHELGALAYTFVGGNVMTVETLRDHYHNAKVSDSAFCDTLKHLFEESCQRWYGSMESYRGNSGKRLDALYREQLNLADEAKVNELRGAMRRLVGGTAAGRQTFKLVKGGSLRVNVDEKTRLVLPDPVAFALGTGGGAAGRKRADGHPFPTTSLLAITHGDLHASNVIVKNGRTWLIDFYKTGVGHVMRDFAELESDIKFTLLDARNFAARYQLEKALLAPKGLDESPALDKPTRQQARALAAIRQLRQLACEVTEIKDTREYYVALLFYALKGISGFSSASGNEHKRDAAQLHALLSAAMICRKLQTLSPGREGAIFLAHEYKPRYDKLIYAELRPSIHRLKYDTLHPLYNSRLGPQLWSRVASMIEDADAGLYEISTRNGNVYFELGYAVGARKPYFALVSHDKADSLNRASLLGGELVHAYKSRLELKRQVRQIIKSRADWKDFFFLKPEFERKAGRLKARRRTALLLVAPTRRQQREFEPLLKRVLEDSGWAVEVARLEHEVNIEKFYLKVLRAGLVVGCLASDRARNARQANAELALALGMAHGMRKSTVILQERQSGVLTDLKSLTVTFRGVAGAGEILAAELRAMDGGRGGAEDALRPARQRGAERVKAGQGAGRHKGPRQAGAAGPRT